VGEVRDNERKAMKILYGGCLASIEFV